MKLAICSRNVSIYGRRGLLVRTVYLVLAAIFWILTGLGYLFRRKKIVLCYHAITSQQRERFAWQMRRIADRTVDVSDFSSGHGTFWGQPLICVTFDDAFECLIQNALPVLNEHGIHSIVFPVVDNFGSKPKWMIGTNHPEEDLMLMTAEQLRSAADAGQCKIGSHTMNHLHLSERPSFEMRQELEDSKFALEKIICRPIEDLALPHGSYNRDTLAEALATGYRRVFTLDAVMCDGRLREGIFGRFLMSPDVWRIEFILTCAGAYAWLHAWRRMIHRGRYLIRYCLKVEPKTK